MTRKRGNIQTDEQFLRSVALPKATDTYTVIGHGTIIDKVRNELSKNGFTIDKEKYISSFDGEIALCKVYLKCDKDTDMGMIFTWWNSYNKRVKFGCAVGSFIYDNQASLIGSEGMSWIRKHTGTADEEADSILEQLIAAANDYFDKIIAEKNKMKALPLSVEDYGCIMGALYFEHELITPTQASAVIQERKKPTNNYSDRDTLWGLYKILMFGIEGMDITKWVKSQQKLHHMIMTEYAIVEETKDERQVWADKVLAEGDGNEHVGPPEMYQGDEELIVFENKEAFIDQIVQQFQVDKPLAEYFADNHFDAIKTAKENMDAFAAYTQDIPAKPMSEEQIDAVKEEHGKEDVSITFEQPEPSDDDLDLILSVDENVSDVLNNLDEPVEIIDPKEDFVFPTDLDNKEKLQDSMIKDKMKNLYGFKKSYTIKNDFVIIDETLEAFHL